MSQISINYNSAGFPDFGNYTPGADYFVKSDNYIGKFIAFEKDQQIVRHPDYFIANSALIKRIGYGIKILHPIGSPIILKINGRWQGPFDWHHHEDGVTLMPVLSVVHRMFVHTGGVSIIEKGLKEIFESPE